MENKFYLMSHGWANKYFWLEPNWGVKYREDSEKLIKNQIENTFRPKSGTTPADILGGSIIRNAYSESLIKLLRDNGIKLKVWPINFILSEKIKKKVKVKIPTYYYVEPTFFVETLRDGDYLSKTEREKTERALNLWIKKNSIIIHTTQDDLKLKGLQRDFFNISNWNGVNLFGAKGTSFIIVTEKLKKIVEKAKLKNIEFEELKLFGGKK